jgi:hypothetical protein
MSEIILFMRPSKETEKKLRWEVEIEGVLFELYIPKWRIPDPWPGRIVVRLAELDADAVRPHLIAKFGRTIDLEQPIVSVVARAVERTQTVRFMPLGDPRDWEIGEPYVPYDLLSDDQIQCLQIAVEWDRSAGGWRVPIRRGFLLGDLIEAQRG